MYRLTGFSEIPSLIDNASGQLADIGELSDISRTATKHKRFYNDPVKGEVNLVLFESLDLDSLPIEPPTTGIDSILTVTNWLRTQAANGTIGGTSLEITQQLNAQFGTVIDQVEVGTPKSDGSTVLPTWVSWRVMSDPIDSGIRIWFSDAEFRTEFTSWEIVVIPPVDDLNTLFGSRESIVNAIGLRTWAQQTALITTARDNNPETLFRTDVFRCVTGAGSLDYVDTNWTVLIYGFAGNNIDNIKQAIIEYVLANSDYDEEEWRERFPSLFISTEFIIVPHFDRTSIENQQIIGSLYTPIISPALVTSYLFDFAPYPTNWIETTGRASVFTYKSIAFSVVGNPDNLDNESEFDLKFRDYIAVHTSSPDFARMSTKTRNWLLLMDAMLPYAENLTIHTQLPQTITRIQRDGKTYLGGSVDGVLYLVVPRNLVVP